MITNYQFPEILHCIQSGSYRREHNVLSIVMSNSYVRSYLTMTGPGEHSGQPYYGERHTERLLDRITRQQGRMGATWLTICLPPSPLGTASHFLLALLLISSKKSFVAVAPGQHLTDVEKHVWVAIIICDTITFVDENLPRRSACCFFALISEMIFPMGDDASPEGPRMGQ